MTDENAPTEEHHEETKPSRASRIRNRLSGIGAGAVIALLVGLLVGGAGGFAVGALTTGHGPGDRGEMHGRPFGDEGIDGDGDDRGFAPPPGGLPGQTPPSTAPDESGDLNG